MQQAVSRKIPALAPTPAAGFAVTLRRAPLALIHRLGAWQRQAEERARLTKLSDHQLKDMGLSRGAVEEMARKTVWQR